MAMEWDDFSPDVERGLFAGAGPQGSTEDFAAVEDGWAGAQGSTFLDRDWVADPAGAAQGSTEAAGLAPARRASRNTSQYSFTLESSHRRWSSVMSHYCLLTLNIKRWSSSVLGTLIYVIRAEKQEQLNSVEDGWIILSSHLKLNLKKSAVLTWK